MPTSQEARPGAAAERDASPEMPRWSAERRAGPRHGSAISGDPEIGPTARRVTGAAGRTPARPGPSPPPRGGGRKGTTAHPPPPKKRAAGGLPQREKKKSPATKDRGKAK